MGLFSGIFGKKEEAPPEPLVLGAKLRCDYGSQTTFLNVATDNISINNLPQACVEDSQTPGNIKPFGMCSGVECELQISLDAKWVNAEPQNARVNGKEIITTKSTLTCNKTGMLIRAVTSGQDGIFAKELIFAAEMEAKYPDLLAILQDSDGSLYLNEGKYEQAIQFLEDRMNAHGGSIELINMYGAGLEGECIRGALERLLRDGNAQNYTELMENLVETAIQQNMDNVPGWNPNYMNPAMIELIKKDCRETSENINKGGLYRAQEESRAFSSWLREGVDAAAYSAVLYAGAMRESIKSAQKKPEANAKKAEEGSKPKGAVKQNNAPKIKGAKVNKGGSGSVLDNYPKTRQEIHNDLINKGYTTNGPSGVKGNVVYKGPDGKQVVIKDTGEVITTHKVKIDPNDTAWNAKKYPQRQYYDGTVIPDGSHSTGQFVEPIDNAGFVPPGNN